MTRLANRTPRCLVLDPQNLETPEPIDIKLDKGGGWLCRDLTPYANFSISTVKGDGSALSSSVFILCPAFLPQKVSVYLQPLLRNPRGGSYRIGWNYTAVTAISPFKVI